MDALFDADGVALCSDCGGAVKPDVVLFGEMLPRERDRRGRTELAERPS